MQEINKSNLALGAAWAILPTLGGILAIFALGKYEYLLISAATGFVSLSLLEESRSKRIFAACLVMSIVAGAIGHLAFLRPDGNITGAGIAFFFMPAMAINVFFVLRIYFIEVAARKLE